MKKTQSLSKLLSLLVLIGILLFVPYYFRSSGYLVNAMLEMIKWICFALAFDLVAGHIGAVSLGQPVFYGIGAYITAYLSKTFHTGFFANWVISALAMAILATVVGIAFFRIKKVTFAIGTLGANIIALLIARSAVNITGGDLCTTDVPRPVLSIPFTDISLTISQPLQYFYLLLVILLIIVLAYRAITTSRLGRAFTAVREDELRASAVGIFPLRYKLLAFATSAALIGALGSFQVQYVTVVCPTELGQELTTSLLIMVFVGGAGSIRGVVFGAALFSVLPRILESVGTGTIPPAAQNLIYGVILVSVMLFLPNGLDGWLSSITGKLRKKKKEEV